MLFIIYLILTLGFACALIYSTTDDYYLPNILIFLTLIVSGTILGIIQLFTKETRKTGYKFLVLQIVAIFLFYLFIILHLKGNNFSFKVA